MVAHESPEDEALRLELQEAIVSFRHWTSQMTQAAGFIVTGDVVLISYGFSQKLAGILLLASALPIGILLVYLVVMSIVTPLAHLILKIERKLKIREDSLGVTFAQIHLRSMIANHKAIECLDDEEVRILPLSGPTIGWLKKTIPLILYAATIVQIGLFVLSLEVFHYHFM